MTNGRHGTRGTTTALSYVLALGIAMLLIGGLFMTTGSFLQDRREQTVRAELRVIGQQVAADYMTVDRLTRITDENASVDVAHELPATVTGTQYTIAARKTPTQKLLLSAHAPNVTVSISVSTQTALESESVLGGAIGVTYDDDADTLVITNG
jgi:hypothetical protein